MRPFFLTKSVCSEDGLENGLENGLEKCTENYQRVNKRYCQSPNKFLEQGNPVISSTQLAGSDTQRPNPTSTLDNQLSQEEAEKIDTMSQKSQEFTAYSSNRKSASNNYQLKKALQISLIHNSKPSSSFTQQLIPNPEQIQIVELKNNGL